MARRLTCLLLGISRQQGNQQPFYRLITPLCNLKSAFNQSKSFQEGKHEWLPLKKIGIFRKCQFCSQFMFCLFEIHFVVFLKLLAKILSRYCNIVGGFSNSYFHFPAVKTFSLVSNSNPCHTQAGKIKKTTLKIFG